MAPLRLPQARQEVSSFPHQHRLVDWRRQACPTDQKPFPFKNNTSEENSIIEAESEEVVESTTENEDQDKS